MPLALLLAEECAEVLEIREGNPAISRTGQPEGGTAARICQGRVEDMGLRVGKMVEVLRNAGRGPILLKVDESRIAIGRGIAMKIMVRRT